MSATLEASERKSSNPRTGSLVLQSVNGFQLDKKRVESDCSCALIAPDSVCDTETDLSVITPAPIVQLLGVVTPFMGGLATGSSTEYFVSEYFVSIGAGFGGGGGCVGCGFFLQKLSHSTWKRIITYAISTTERGL